MARLFLFNFLLLLFFYYLSFSIPATKLLLFEDMGNPPSRVEDSPSLSVYAAEIRFFAKKEEILHFLLQIFGHVKKKQYFCNAKIY